ncbi:hypothetical protein A7U60_g2300 [Sanghuangporus baumii]|uniref:Uncharacterized protein n=1 Tax=Sanghuangporus baumii TaxID=108892 RepID=A0A9Q5I2I9_SANBA|nr:hypothetical protein A7U60_g2300 [Sanghuangporus baumii]
MFTSEEIVALLGPINSNNDWKAAVAKFEVDVALARSAIDELDHGITTVILLEKMKPVEWIAPTDLMMVWWLTNPVMESLIDEWKATTAWKEALEQVHPKGTKEVWLETVYSNYCDMDALLQMLHRAPFQPASFDSTHGFFLGESFPPMFPKLHPNIKKALENVRMESSKFQRTARFTGNTDYTQDEAVQSYIAFEYWEDIDNDTFV